MADLRLVPASGAAPSTSSADTTMVGRDPTCDIVIARRLRVAAARPRSSAAATAGWSWTRAAPTAPSSTASASSRARCADGQELRFGAIAYRVEIRAGTTTSGPPSSPRASPEATVVQHAPSIAAAAPPRRRRRPSAAARRRCRRGPRLPRPRPRRRAGGAAHRPGRRRSAAPAYSPSSPVPSMAPPPLPPKKGRSPFFWIGLGCCGCLLLVVADRRRASAGRRSFATRGAVDAVRAQIADIKAGHMDAAYQRMSDGYRQSHSAADFAAFVERHPGLKENTDSTFTSPQRHERQGRTSPGYLMAAAGAKETVAYELVKAGGDWKIEDIKFDDEAAATAPGGGGGGPGRGPGDRDRGRCARIRPTTACASPSRSA